MFTQCPHCQNTLILSTGYLQTKSRLITCENCNSIFDALKYLSKTKKAEEPQMPTHTLIQTNRLPWEPESETNFSNYWKAGFLAVLLLLLVQLVYFGKDAVIQNPGYRAKLETLCQKLHCTLPVYKSPQEIEVLSQSFAQMPDGNFELLTIFSNHAPFAQAYPVIKLTLLDKNEKPFAERLFSPSDYLPKSTQDKPMSAQEIAVINLKISAPLKPVGGYQVSLAETL
jgi:hypothetical protein